jgi:tryptophan 2,3-dioxygenase
VIVGESTLSEYASYLGLEDVLQAQRPRSAAHDEVLFIVVHQVHELWFKLLLHEFSQLQLQLSQCETAHALQTLRRSLSILRVVVSPMDVLETLTPRQFGGFRPVLGNGSGFQSAQFREIEAVLGRRDRRMYEYFGEGSDERARIEAAMNRPSMYDSLLRFLALNGYPVPADWLHRDVSQPLLPSTELQSVLTGVYRDDDVAAQICELLVEIDQGVQEWRYRHVSLVSRMIGDKPGTGGSSGASYLRSTLFRPVFPDLWAVRSAL